MRSLPISAALGPILLAAFLVGAASSAAQEPDSLRTDDALRVYLECSGGMGCDQREFRTEIDWVHWMRDRRDAQLHVIVTTQGTGSGGQIYQLDYIGLDALAGTDDRLTFTTLGTDVRDEAVRGVTRVLGVGLARYALLAGFAPPVDLVRSAGAGGDGTNRLVGADQVDDPWNFWVFEVDFNTNLSGEESRTNRRFGGGVDASRVTPDWKFEFLARGNWRRDEIVLTDSTVVDTRRDWNVEGALVHSLAEHWSLGGLAEVSAATLTNRDLSMSIGPQLEFSFWPYEESPRRSLRARYFVRLRHFDYETVTLFGYTEETRPAQELAVSISQRQPWGQVFANVSASHYLHDPSKYRVDVGGFLSFRVVRGLSLFVNGGTSWIRDQLFLSAEGVSDEERLLERRRVASNFDWNFGTGFSFQFGSIYNNVVNNRF